MEVSGGGLGATYSTLQFHFHWGTEQLPGSEHTVDGMRYAMEVEHHDRPPSASVLEFVDKFKENEEARGFIGRVHNYRK